MYIQPLEYDVMWYATVTWRARRATDDGKTNRKQKKNKAVGRGEKKKTRVTYKGPSSAPLDLCHTDIELALGVWPA